MHETCFSVGPAIKRMLLLLLVWSAGIEVRAQNKLGANPTVINPNAILELDAPNKGLLLSRVSLDSTLLATPLSSFVKGMLVYNLQSVHDVSEGVYYCDGTKWIKLSGNAQTGWNLEGNEGTAVTHHFVGTIDSMAFAFRTNNMERMRIDANGNIGLGTSAPTARLHIGGQVSIDTVLSGSVVTDSVLLWSETDKKVKRVTGRSFLQEAGKEHITVLSNGQTDFTTPYAITDPNRILLYRNGIQIGFTVAGNNVISAEVPCVAGDEIKIVQFN